MIIPVTEPFLPPINEYNDYLKYIWKNNWLTNDGPLLRELESQLKSYLHFENMSIVSNGTIALQIAIKALSLSGEIVTTPFSYVATTSSIVWENCKPVFADIDKDTFNIDPEKIEPLITNNTCAILATHVYGNPCKIEAIQLIAKKHKLKIIYDAAQAFGVTYKDKSIFEYGDISTTSFHATKLFHTIEGGAVFTKDIAILKKIISMRNFGHNGPESFKEIGINGKNSEFHAAMGLCNLKYIEEILKKRKELYFHYKNKILNLDLDLRLPKLNSNASYNYTYFPVLFQSKNHLLRAKKELEKVNIHTRRYFYPLLSNLNYVQSQSVPIAENIACRTLCLPLYHNLTKKNINFICDKLKSYT